jgi:hypothetical protein
VYSVQLLKQFTNLIMSLNESSVYMTCGRHVKVPVCICLLEIHESSAGLMCSLFVWICGVMQCQEMLWSILSFGSDMTHTSEAQAGEVTFSPA